MKVERFLEIIESDFYTGVPDSQLKELINYLISTYGIDPKHHIIAANEGNCAAIAVGYHLATGKVPVVYLQNSGEGNIINPVVSLLSEKVYAVPAIFIIGWRGEPGEHDEPQHIYQGEITVKLLDDIGIKSFIVSKDTTDEDVINAMDDFKKELCKGKNIAIIIRKGALHSNSFVKYENNNIMTRERIIQHIVKVSKDDPIVTTTGKASRELFEIREANQNSHKYDFLTVGSMGHASSIALGISINKDSKIWCIDGDGAVLMHMGAMPVIGSISPNNMIHIVINNGSHESVGGMPTVASGIELAAIAKACGYSYSVSVDTFEELDNELELVKSRNELSFIEVKSSIGARETLGRPTSTPTENKIAFMNYLNSIR